jgi:uridine phosphorylase
LEDGHLDSGSADCGHRGSLKVKPPQLASGRSPESESVAALAALSLLRDKEHFAPSVFLPEALLREARRQKQLPAQDVPAVCLLDPDGDIVRRLRQTGIARRHGGWACYHTELFTFDLEGFGEVGVVGCAVGAPFAVLVAEQLFVSGCRLLISITSAGEVAAAGAAAPYFVLIDRALRDEGTSAHYLPPAPFADAPDLTLLNEIHNALRVQTALHTAMRRGATWTTDAPFRETRGAIDAARASGVLAVEMEAAALYAFAKAKGKSVVCFAHVTNAMGQVEGDFEKGEADGVAASLLIAATTARTWAATGEATK